LVKWLNYVDTTWEYESSLKEFIPDTLAKFDREHPQ
jgi:hypothetical protein